ncbi:MAG TPA: hypothetical protein VMI54_29420 [Polyangiaceae bacterium]|nr:hypothetical protein [Polyangiaceae bacterium]
MSKSNAERIGANAALVVGLFVALAGCGGTDASGPATGGAKSRGAGGNAGSQNEAGAGQDASAAAGGDTGRAPGTSADVGAPAEVASGSASMIGVTSDDWALYRNGDNLIGSKLGTDETAMLTDQPGNTLIHGRVVYTFANVDWTANVGDLSVWTAAGGVQEIGPTTYSESLIAASDAGDFLVYTANTNTKKDKTDLMIASNDFALNDALIPGMGLGSDTTCSAVLGFVGEALFVGYCAPGSRDATIERFDFDGSNWNPTTIADQVLPAWSADSKGDGVFYQTSDYQGYYASGGQQYRIDASVSRGFLVPDGSAALYTVGDQLRRSTVPEANPVPIVTTGFAEPVAFTSDYGMALYSTQVTYENGTERDLHLVATDGFNPEPIDLVSDPVAAMPRSSMTDDGKFVLYLTDVTDTGGTLHVVGMDGTEVLSLPGVLDAVAARGSGIVFTDNASDPSVYPNVGDLEYVDPAASSTPTLIEAAVMDPKNFQLDAELDQVVYVRSGVGRESDDPEQTGVFSCDLP